jgi:hypothetical protein
MVQHPDPEWVDRYYDEKMKEYGVDDENEQARRTVRAMNKYMKKVTEMRNNYLDLIMETGEREFTLRKRLKAQSRE